MNVKRVLLGGLLAGVFITVSEGVLNGVVLMDEYQAILSSTGLTEASWAMTGYIVGTLVFGFAVAWLYAAIRPRFGGGWKTGALAGTVLWIVGYGVPSVWLGAMGLTMTAAPTVLALVWGIAELVLAGVIAGWLYQEGAASPSSATTAAAPPAA